MRKYRVHCNSIATRERFERALQEQGFKTFTCKKEFDKIKLQYIEPDYIIYYIIWEDGVYTLSHTYKSLGHLRDDRDYIDGRQVTSKAKWLRQQINGLKEEEQ